MSLHAIAAWLKELMSACRRRFVRRRSRTVIDSAVHGTVSPRTARIGFAIFAIGLTVLILTSFLQSYVGRASIVAQDRRQCMENEEHFVIPVINAIRTAQQTELSQPNLNAAAAALNQDLVVINRHVDPRYDQGLNPFGKAIVKSFGGNHYSCDAAHPAATILGLKP
jgi:hypothetical protein